MQSDNEPAAKKQKTIPYFNSIALNSDATLFLRSNRLHNPPMDAPDNESILMKFKDETWVAISEKTSTEVRFHIETMNPEQVEYLANGHSFQPSKTAMPIEEFKARHDPLKPFEFKIRPEQSAAPITQSAFITKETNHVELVGMYKTDNELHLDLFHRREHVRRHDDDFNCTIYVSARLFFVRAW